MRALKLNDATDSSSNIVRPHKSRVCCSHLSCEGHLERAVLILEALHHLDDSALCSYMRPSHIAHRERFKAAGLLLLFVE